MSVLYAFYMHFISVLYAFYIRTKRGTGEVKQSYEVLRFEDLKI